MKAKPFLVPIVTAVVTAIAVLLATMIVDDGVETLEKGQQAATVDQIKTVMQEVMVADVDGVTMTYGQILSSTDRRLTTMEADLSNMKDALKALSEE